MSLQTLNARDIRDEFFLHYWLFGSDNVVKDMNDEFWQDELQLSSNNNSNSNSNNNNNNNNNSNNNNYKNDKESNTLGKDYSSINDIDNQECEQYGTILNSNYNNNNINNNINGGNSFVIIHDLPSIKGQVYGGQHNGSLKYSRNNYNNNNNNNNINNGDSIKQRQSIQCNVGAYINTKPDLNKIMLDNSNESIMWLDRGDVKGSLLLAICESKEGSRYIQTILETSHEDKVKSFMTKIWSFMDKLCINIAGHYVILKLLSICQTKVSLISVYFQFIDEIICKNLSNMINNIYSAQIISYSLHCHNINIQNYALYQISNILTKNDTRLVHNASINVCGNRIIQTIIEKSVFNTNLPKKPIKCITNYVIENVLPLCIHQYACRVVQSIIKCHEINAPCINQLFRYLAEICNNSNGNYSIQMCLEYSTLPKRSEFIEEIFFGYNANVIDYSQEGKYTLPSENSIINHSSSNENLTDEFHDSVQIISNYNNNNNDASSDSIHSSNDNATLHTITANSTITNSNSTSHSNSPMNGKNSNNNNNNNKKSINNDCDKSGRELMNNNNNESSNNSNNMNMMAVKPNYEKFLFGQYSSHVCDKAFQLASMQQKTRLIKLLLYTNGHGNNSNNNNGNDLTNTIMYRLMHHQFGNYVVRNILYHLLKLNNSNGKYLRKLVFNYLLKVKKSLILSQKEISFTYAKHILDMIERHAK